MFRIALRLLLDQPSKSLGTLLGVIVSTFLMAQQVSTFLGILGRVSAFADGTEMAASSSATAPWSESPMSTAAVA